MQDRTRVTSIMLLTAFLFSFCLVSGVHADGEQPLGLSGQVQSLSSVQQIVMSPVDKSALEAEDTVRQQQGLAPVSRFPLNRTTPRGTREHGKV